MKKDKHILIITRVSLKCAWYEDYERHTEYTLLRQWDRNPGTNSEILGNGTTKKSKASENCPHYRSLTEFLKAHGVKKEECIIRKDTYSDCGNIH